jgi:hypothetical protein
MAKEMMNSITAAVALGLLLAPANAEIVWDTTYGKSPARRLAIELVNSHNDTKDAACIVGGYDADHPTRIYVGGPCELIVNGEPQTGFRYVVMETVDATLASMDGSEVYMERYTGYGSRFQHAADHENYAEAGAGLSVHFVNTSIQHASLFLSTTSYLAKANFGFTKNSFVIGVDEDDSSKKKFISDVCVAPCTGTTPVICTTCPTKELSVTKGMYKYSILAASWNYGTATSQGWEKVVATYGTGTPKTLSGYLNVYQAIDFSNMQADTLTITAADDTSVTYAKMDPCNMETFKSQADASKDCQTYTFKEVEVKSDGWTGKYAFPQTFNVGSWSMADEDSPVVPAQMGTRDVVILCVRPSSSDLIKVGMTASTKAIYVAYLFDVSGIDAGPNKGKYMVYDPTITSAKGTNGTDAGTAGTAGETNAGRIACGPAVAFFTTMFLVALGGFM